MSEGIRKYIVACAAVAGAALLFRFAYSRPWLFTNESWMTDLIVLQALIVAVCFYRKVYFPIVLFSFLFAGCNVPFSPFFSAGRWMVLGVGATVGCFIMLKQGVHRFGIFHAISLVAVLAAVASATESRHSTVTLLKALSFLLLFVYASTGLRVAVAGREGRFFAGLLLGGQIFFVLVAVTYAMGMEVLGNPNSLGATVAVLGIPLTLYGVFSAQEKSVRNWRILLYAVCMLLVFVSRARAGILTALLVSGMLCLAVKNYRALIQGTLVLCIVITAIGLTYPELLPSMTSTLVYKNARAGEGLLASRQSPWSTAWDNISQHPWLGTGLGTTSSSIDSEGKDGLFTSKANVTAENGSSYLSLLAGLGVVGAIPFALLISILLTRCVRTFLYARRTGLSNYGGLLTSAILVAGLVHAVFEDWLFAPGAYLCVLFWCLAFVLMELEPAGARVPVVPVPRHQAHEYHATWNATESPSVN